MSVFMSGGAILGARQCSYCGVRLSPAAERHGECEYCGSPLLAHIGDEPVEPTLLNYREPSLQILSARWQKKIQIDGRGCWIWTGTLDGQGYPTVKGRSAVRAIYSMCRPAIPPDKMCRRECGQRLCVNPAHVTLVPRSFRELERLKRQLVAQLQETGELVSALNPDADVDVVAEAVGRIIEELDLMHDDEPEQRQRPEDS